jgi:hypothetical protein
MRTRTEFVPATVGIAIIFVALIVVTTAWADGGIVRVQAGDGPLVATLFSPAEISRDLATELNVLTQDRVTGEVVMTAEVELRFSPPPGARMPLNDPWCRPSTSTLLAAPNGSLETVPTVRLTRSQSDNKLLCGVSVVFPVAGEWRAQLTVRQGDRVISHEVLLPVRESSNRLAAVWPWLALPPCLIGLFALNQRLGNRRR